MYFHEVMQRKKTSKCWYVLTAYRKDNLALADLEKEADRCRQEGNEGLAYFMPMCYRMVGPEGKKVRKKLPLLPGYVFVHGSIEELEAYMRAHPYLAFYHPVIKEYGGVIAVPDGQMESFMRVAQEYEEDIRYFRPDEIDWEAGDSVRIVGGKLDGVEGMLQCVKGKSGGRVVVSIPGLVAVSTWEISPDYLEILSFAPVGRRLYHNLDVFFSNARTALGEMLRGGVVGEKERAGLSASVRRLQHLSTGTTGTACMLSMSLLMARTVLGNGVAARQDEEGLAELVRGLRNDCQRVQPLVYLYGCTGNPVYRAEARRFMAGLDEKAMRDRKWRDTFADFQIFEKIYGEVINVDGNACGHGDTAACGVGVL